MAKRRYICANARSSLIALLSRACAYGQSTQHDVTTTWTGINPELLEVYGAQEPRCPCTEDRTPQVMSLVEPYLAIAVVNVFVGAARMNGYWERTPMVARVSIADYYNRSVYDTYVRPTHQIRDLRVAETGLKYMDLMMAPSFEEVQMQVASLIRNKVLIGHRLWNVLSVLGLSHAALHTRDMALYRPLRRRLKRRVVVSLQDLVRRFVGEQIGLHQEDSLETARGAMDVFRYTERAFEDVVGSGGWPCDLPPVRYAEYYL